VTGGLAFFGYDVFGPPFLRYHEMDASGDVVHTTPIEIPRATMQHDFGVSASKVVFMDLPVVFDSELAATGASLPFRWMEEAGARLGVLDRAAPGSEVRWVGLDPCYVFHVMNAFDEGDDVLLDVCRYEKTFDIGTGGPLGSVSPSLQRWRIRPTRTGPRSSSWTTSRSSSPASTTAWPGSPIATATAPSSTTPTRSGRPPGWSATTSDAARPSATPSPSTSHPVNRSSCVPPMGGPTTRAGC